jgi:predicted RNA-binding protein with PUA-like domain
MKTSYWLLKTEPETYSFERLLKEKRTNWDQVRNYQARNHLRQIAPGDIALIYHSGDAKAVVGIAKVIREAYPDPDPENDGDWVQVDLAPVEALASPVTLSAIKGTPKLATLPLIRQSRLSVMPITREHYETIVRMGKAPGKPR